MKGREDMELSRARHAGSTDPVFRRFDNSIRFDVRLYRQDIEQSRAHARMLAACGAIDDGDRDEIIGGLDRVLREFEGGSFEVHEADEDVHMAVERRLTELVGPAGGKLQTARSRNDQVATDVAMFVGDHAEIAASALGDVMTALVGLAQEHIDWAMPGYTHLQRAKPIYLSHHLLAYVWMFLRDRDRFFNARSAAKLLPLGSGAMAGVNWDVDRRFVARELGFDGIVENSIDAVSNRDFVLDYVSAAATCATHLSRLGAELVLWSSEEFGFCELPDGFTSGSSIMPQKKNPDAAELLRAKAPRVVGHLAALHGVMHGLPLTYNKDMQEDKEHLFDTVDTIELSLSVTAGMLRGVAFKRDRLAVAAADEFLRATDIADHLARRGLPFREAHAVVGRLVRTCLESNRAPSDLSANELRAVSTHLDEEVEALLLSSGQDAKVSEGGTAIGRVKEQIDRARGAIGGDPPGGR